MAITPEERSAFRLSVAEREIPRAILVSGVCLALITILNFVLGTPMPMAMLALNLCVVALLLSGAALIRRQPMRASTSAWIAAGSATLLVVAVQIQVWVDPDAIGFAYVLLIAVAYGPLILAWLPTAVAAVPILAGCVVLATKWPADEAVDWVIASIAAIAIGRTLLWLRIRSIDELAEMTALAQTLATRDALTGTLNRRGLKERLPQLVSLAARRQELLFAMFVDVDRLKVANDEHGHGFGDRVIASVAQAVTATMRSGDLVARWGGDEFLVVGIGHAQQSSVLGERVRSAIAASDLAKGEWPIDVSVGWAVMQADGIDIDALVEGADADMYARRRERRGG